jgi:hypothetical protein
MKKIIAAVTILLILVTGIGFELIRSGQQSSISSSRIAGEATSKEVMAFEGRPSKAVSKELEQHELVEADSRLSKTSQIDAARNTNFENDSTSEKRLSGKISSLYFIRSSSIVGTKEPSEKQIDRLKRSVAKAAEGLRSGSIIFDGDGVSNSEVPFLLYSAEERDVSGGVKDVYDKLRMEAKEVLKTVNVEPQR